nr:hypothetical protein CFP56_43853 [Quercus suber]
MYPCRGDCTVATRYTIRARARPQVTDPAHPSPSNSHHFFHAFDPILSPSFSLPCPGHSLLYYLLSTPLVYPALPNATDSPKHTLHQPLSLHRHIDILLPNSDTMKYFATSLIAACAASVVSAQSSTASSDVSAVSATATASGSVLSSCPTATGVYGGYTYTDGTLMVSSTGAMSSGMPITTGSSSGTGSNSTTMSTGVSPTPSGFVNAAGSLQAAGLSAVLIGMVGAAFL